MCGESARTRFDELLRRPREVELAIGGRDLLGVGHAVLGLRLEVRVGEDAVEQPRGDLRRALEDGARVVVGAELERLLRRDRPRVELGRRAVDRDAGARVAGHQRALDRRGAAPARQQRRVHVEPERPREQRLRDQQAVRGDDDRVGRDLDAVVEPRGLRDGDAEPLGDLLRGGRLQRAAAPARLVGPRQQQRDVVLRREPLEHVGAERRGGRDGDAGH